MRNLWWAWCEETEREEFTMRLRWLSIMCCVTCLDDSTGWWTCQHATSWPLAAVHGYLGQGKHMRLTWSPTSKLVCSFCGFQKLRCDCNIRFVTLLQLFPFWFVTERFISIWDRVNTWDRPDHRLQNLYILFMVFKNGDAIIDDIRSVTLL